MPNRPWLLNDAPLALLAGSALVVLLSVGFLLLASPG
jgi:hypothetical protein